MQRIINKLIVISLITLAVQPAAQAMEKQPSPGVWARVWNVFKPSPATITFVESPQGLVTITTVGSDEVRVVKLASADEREQKEKEAREAEAKALIDEQKEKDENPNADSVRVKPALPSTPVPALPKAKAPALPSTPPPALPVSSINDMTQEQLEKALMLAIKESPKNEERIRQLQLLLAEKASAPKAEQPAEEIVEAEVKAAAAKIIAEMSDLELAAECTALLRSSDRDETRLQEILAEQGRRMQIKMESKRKSATKPTAVSAAPSKRSVALPAKSPAKAAAPAKAALPAAPKPAVPASAAPALSVNDKVEQQRRAREENRRKEEGAKQTELTRAGQRILKSRVYPTIS